MMCPVCPPAGNLCYLCGADHGAQVASPGRLADMPEEIIREFFSFAPQSVLILRVVSRALQQKSDDCLQWNMERIVALCSDASSTLYRRILSNFVSCSTRFQRVGIHFHSSIPGVARSLDVPYASCPARILTLEAIEHLRHQVDDIHLHGFWTSVRTTFARANPVPAGLPPASATALTIRTWMHENPALLQSITELNLNHRDLGGVPVEMGLFAGLQTLDLTGNQLCDLWTGHFDGLTQLHSLDVSNNRFNSFLPGQFSGLAGLHILRLHYNPLVSLPAGVFDGLAGLMRLSIYGCRFGSQGLHSLPSGVFDGLTALRGLALCGNNLRSLPHGVFDRLTELQSLDLHNNALSSLAPGLFDGLSALQELLLYDNPHLLISDHQLLSDKYESNLAFPGVMEAFFSYPCRTPFARFYQLVAGDSSPEVVAASFSELDQATKFDLLHWTWIKADCPGKREDLQQWGELHLFDDMFLFNSALKKVVEIRFERLTSHRQMAVYRHVFLLAQTEQGALDDVHAVAWGKWHALDNISRLIDAMEAAQRPVP